MVDVYRALARVQVPAGAVAATGTVRTSGTGTEPGAWWATVDTGEELPEALFPRTSRQQYVGLRIRIGGETLDPRFLLGGITVQQKVEGFAVFRFAVVLEVESERWPLGDPWALRAPAPGLAPVDIDGLYATSSGVFAYRLLTNGLVNETSIEDVGGAEGLVVRGLGPGARYQRRRVSLHLPPDHRTPRGVVVRRLAQLASVVGESIPAGRPMRKELSLDRSAWLETARQLLELEGLHLTWSEDGTLAAVPRLPNGTHQAVITERDLLRLSTRARFRSDVPTEIRLTAEEELLDTEAGCGRRSTSTTTEVLELGVPRRAKWRINGNGPWTLDPVSPPPGEAPSLQVVRRVITEQEELCGTLVSSVVRTWELKNPEVWRYRIEEIEPQGGTTRIVSQNRGAYLYDEQPDPTAEGSEAAFQWQVPRFVLVSEEFTTREFGDQGLLERITVSTKGWYLQRWALKERPSDFTTWEAAPLLQPTYTLGGGESIGPAPISERYSPGNVGSADPQDGAGFGQFVARETTTYQIEGPYVVAETVTREAPYIPPGSAYLFHGETGSAIDRQRFGPVEQEVTTYAALGEERSLRSVARSDLTVTPGGETQSVETEEVASYLPEAERLVDGSDPEFPQVSQVRQLEHTCRSAVLAAHHPARQVDQRVDFAEDEQDLASLCLQKLREGALIDVEFRLPACFGLRKGVVVRGLLPRVGLRHHVLVTEVITTSGPEGITTTLKGKARAV